MKNLLPFLAALLLSGTGSAVLAQSDSAGSTSVQPPGENASSDNTKPTHTFQGGVKGTALPFDEGVGRIMSACSLIQETTEHIIKEASRKDTVVLRGPNVLPGGTVLPAIGGVGGVMQMGEMPMRKDRLKRWMAQLDQNMAALQSYIDALIVPPNNPAAITAYNGMRTSMVRAQTHFDLLKDLTSRKRQSNDRVAAEAVAIHEALDDVLKQRAALIGALNEPVSQPAQP